MLTIASKCQFLEFLAWGSTNINAGVANKCLKPHNKTTDLVSTVTRLTSQEQIAWCELSVVVRSFLPKRRALRVVADLKTACGQSPANFLNIFTMPHHSCPFRPGSTLKAVTFVYILTDKLEISCNTPGYSQNQESDIHVADRLLNFTYDDLHSLTLFLMLMLIKDDGTLWSCDSFCRRGTALHPC
jgi:hypothetical protein